MTTFSALLDTNVIYGNYLNDVLLFLGERGLFRPLWSADILKELEKNLIRNGKDPDRVKHRIDSMQEAFPDASVSDYEYLINSLTCDPKDRHVLATALHAKADVLVTFNIKDFPATNFEKYHIEVVAPDKFLLDQLDLYPGPTTGVLRQLIKDYSNPEITMEDPLIRLAVRCS